MEAKYEMSIAEAIAQLEFDKAMITFDAMNGEILAPDILKLHDPESFKQYMADELAINVLENKVQHNFRETGKDEITVKEAIDKLKLCKESILIDSVTEEKKSLEYIKSINMDNYKTYLAASIAIEKLEELQKSQEVSEQRKSKSEEETEQEDEEIQVRRHRVR